MAIADKIKWDKKYKDKESLLHKREPSKLLEFALSTFNGGKALDLACGAGRNTIYLTQHGFFVDAIDISKVALDTLADRVDKSRVNLIEADLDDYQFKNREYDLIVKTNFLDRDLIKKVKSALKIGGVFVIETYVEDIENEKRNSNPNFLLAKDELLKIFSSGYEVLQYKEFWNEPYEMYKMKKAGIVAKKI